MQRPHGRHRGCRYGRPHGLFSGLIATVFCLISDVSAAGEGTLEFERISVDQGLVHSSVQAMTQDRCGFLWLATRGGLDRFDGHSFQTFKRIPEDKDSLSDNSVSSLLTDSSGALWIGTFNGLDRFDPHTHRFHHLRLDSMAGGGSPSHQSHQSHPHVTALAEDETTTLWIGTRRGLHRLVPTTLAMRRYLHDPKDPKSLGNDDLTSLAFDRSGKLWIGTAGGLFRMDPENETFADFGEQPGGDLTEQPIGALLIDDSGSNELEQQSGSCPARGPSRPDLGGDLHRSEPNGQVQRELYSLFS